MKTFNVVAINIVTLSVLGFMVYVAYNVKEGLVSEKLIKIEYINTNDTLNSPKEYNAKERFIVIESELNKISEINDKRFELLGWGIGILVTTFALFLLVSFVNSKATMRDMIYDELSNKNKEYQKQYATLLKEIKQKREEINSEIKKLEN